MSVSDPGRGDPGRDDPGGELIHELEELLARAASSSRMVHAAAGPVAETDLQRYANELASLCQRVLDEASEATARAFWSFLLATAARHGRRAGGWPT